MWPKSTLFNYLAEYTQYYVRYFLMTTEAVLSLQGEKTVRTLPKTNQRLLKNMQKPSRRSMNLFPPT